MRVAWEGLQLSTDTRGAASNFPQQELSRSILNRSEGRVRVVEAVRRG